MEPLLIASGNTVTFHFALELDNGDTVDSTFDREPATLTVGDGTLPAGFESALLNLSAGEQKTIRIAPKEAFGQPNPNNIQTLPRTAFQSDMTLSEGLVVSFADAANNELPGVIDSFDQHTVTVDFNHPLAGRPLLFRIHILEVS